MKWNRSKKIIQRQNFIFPSSQLVWILGLRCESQPDWKSTLLTWLGGLDGVLEVNFFSGISQWSSEVSQPQKRFCSKMPVGLALCQTVSIIQPSFNPAIPKHVLRLGHLKASLRNTAKDIIYKSSYRECAIICLCCCSSCPVSTQQQRQWVLLTDTHINLLYVF